MRVNGHYTQEDASREFEKTLCDKGVSKEKAEKIAEAVDMVGIDANDAKRKIASGEMSVDECVDYVVMCDQAEEAGVSRSRLNDAINSGATYDEVISALNTRRKNNSLEDITGNSYDRFDSYDPLGERTPKNKRSKNPFNVDDSSIM